MRGPTRWVGWIALASAVLALVPRAAHSSESIRYVLGPGSAIVQVCLTCAAPGTSEPLTGSFALTPIPIAEASRVEALSAVDWRSASYHIAGSGFVQFSRSGQMSVLLETSINGVQFALRPTRRQPHVSGGFAAVLATPGRQGVGYLLIIKAHPERLDAPDADEDGIPDAADNCRTVANRGQQDGDADAVGDACDACPDTGEAALVNPSGCSLAQRCPCDGPAEDEPWAKGAYGRCAAQFARDLRRDGILSRSEAIDFLLRALRSGCGQTVLALR